MGSRREKVKVDLQCGQVDKMKSPLQVLPENWRSVVREMTT